MAPAVRRLCLIFMLAGAVLLVGAVLWTRQEALEEAGRVAADQARSLAYQVGRAVEVSDLVLLQMQDLSGNTDWSDPAAAARAQRYLQSTVARLPYVFRLFMIDTRGQVLASSEADLPPGLSAADRDYFQAQRAADQGLHISARLRSKASGETIFVLSRRVTAGDGRFAGLVSASFAASELSQFYQTMSGAFDPVFELVGADAEVLLRVPSGSADDPRLAPPLETLLRSGTAGTLRHPDSDGSRRIWAVRPVAPYPLGIAVGLSESLVLDAWIADTVPFFASLVLALLGLGLVSAVAIDRASREDLARAALTRLTSDLEERVRQRTTDLEDANQQLKSAIAALERRTWTLETVSRISTILNGELDHGRLVQAITDETTALAGAEFGAFFHNVADDQGGAYMLYTLSGAPREAFARFPMPRNTRLFGPTFRGEGIVRIDDVLTDPRYGHNPPHHGMPAGHLPVRSYLAAAVVARSGEVLGGLFFGHSRPGVFTADTEAVIAGVAAQAAVAMDNARLYTAVQQELKVRREAEARLQASLVEKDAMLREIHHRVRNNLQVISSLLNLEGQRLRDHQLRSGFEAVQRRIGVLASIHQQLYASGNFARIDLKSHIERLGNSLGDLYRDTGGLTLSLDVEPLTCDIDTAIPLGLIINELVTNSAKHAFPGRQNGWVGISLRWDEAREVVELVIEDDGIGMAGGYRHDGGVGSQLVLALSGQLDASLHVGVRADGAPGSRVEVRLPSEPFRSA